MAKSRVTVTAEHAQRVVESRDRVARFMIAATMRHENAIREELAAFDTARDTNPDAWARLCVIKSILSPGARLLPNIAAAKAVYVHMVRGGKMESFEDFAAVVEGLSYGTQCYATSVKALIKSWQTIKTLRADSMTSEMLTALVKSGTLAGQQDKARAWSLALFDSTSQVYTLDRHMLRKLCEIAGVSLPSGDIAIGAKAYRMIASMMLELHGQYFPTYGPLVSQWAIWNETRHPGEHAEHIALAS